MSEIGVTLLGAGRMGIEHARNLAGIPTVRVVSVADPVREAAEVPPGAEVSESKPTLHFGKP